MAESRDKAVALQQKGSSKHEAGTLQAYFEARVSVGIIDEIDILRVLQAARDIGAFAPDQQHEYLLPQQLGSIELRPTPISGKPLWTYERKDSFTAIGCVL